MSTYEPLRKTRPSIIFAGLDGSCLPRRSHRIANIGAKIMTHSGATDWNHAVGYSQPKTERRVARSAKSVRLVPACLYPGQKMTEQQQRMKIEPRRVQS